MRAHTDVEFVEMYSGKNSNVDVKYVTGKLRKRNSMSDVIRLHFWTLFLLRLCTSILHVVNHERKSTFLIHIMNKKLIQECSIHEKFIF
jgi:hypothetical protein